MKRVAVAAALVALAALAAAGIAGGGHRASPTKLSVWVGWSAGKELVTFKKVAAEYDKAHPDVTLDVVGGIVDQKIVAKSQYEAARDWNEYSLTRKGYDLFPVVNALMAWGDRYEAPNGPPVVIRHVCGHSAGHMMVCEHCREALSIKSVIEVPGPGATDAPPKQFLRETAP